MPPPKLPSENGDFLCANCGCWLPEACFNVFKDVRYKKGTKREPYCKGCRKIKIEIWRENNKDSTHRQHDEWREKNLKKDNEEALLWYFARQLSGYRMRAKKKNVPFDLDKYFLFDLFCNQHGKCYYTGDPLIWNNYGKKVARITSMTLDRLTPNRGYTKGNVVLCTMHSNLAKLSLCEEEFYVFCENILKIKEARDAHKNP